MEKETIEKFKTRLLEEKEQLESELKTVGHKNPDNPNDWEADPGDMTSREYDLNDQADKIEEFENRTAILKQLETQLVEVDNALEKIEKGEYGKCEIGGEEISKERLEANPSARTCVEHMNN